MRSWLDGGPTDLDNQVCSAATITASSTAATGRLRLGEDRLPEFIPPAYVDLQQRPHRNRYHRRT
jgi:hypothetical protein